MSTDLTGLYRTLPKRGLNQDSVWPTLSLVLYSDLPAAHLGPHVSSAVEMYVALLPAGTLKSALIRDQMGPLSAQRLQRDLRILAKPDGLQLKIYSSSDRGQPNEFGCTVFMQFLSAEEQRVSATSAVVRFEFPWIWASGASDDLATMLKTLADRMPFSCGIAGYGFSYWAGDRLAADQVRAMLPRYSAFEHSDSRFTSMYGKTPSPSWLTFVSRELSSVLPEFNDLVCRLPTVAVDELKNGWCLRSAQRPPIGDVNRQAADIGCLPSIARGLRPRRFMARAFAGSQVDMNVQAWLARFDDLADRVWNNVETV